MKLAIWHDNERPPRAQGGFTLIEIMVVIVILSLAAALVLPRLPHPEGERLKSSAVNLASGIRFLSDRAIITKAGYRLHLSMSDNSVRIARIGADGKEQAPDDEFMERRLLAEGVAVEDVTLPGLGKLTEGEASLDFGPAGVSDAVTIHLKAGEQVYTVIVYPFGGKVDVLQGYKELEVAT